MLNKNVYNIFKISLERCLPRNEVTHARQSRFPAFALIKFTMKNTARVTDNYVYN